ncbi:hypothetical protein VIGAN_01503800, partial [Vigna angularis var. angularis]
LKYGYLFSFICRKLCLYFVLMPITFDSPRIYGDYKSVFTFMRYSANNGKGCRALWRFYLGSILLGVCLTLAICQIDLLKLPNRRFFWGHIVFRK